MSKYICKFARRNGTCVPCWHDHVSPFLESKMAKYNGGSVLVGKVGSIVYRVRNGQTIASQYQPNVANPSTENQVQVRAKLKLLSQISASVGNVIAIARDGLKSPRNIFTKVNYQFTGFADDAATISLQDLQLTDSAVALAGFTAARDTEKIHVELEESQAAAFDKVAWVILKRNTAGALAVAVEQLVNPGSEGLFPSDLPLVEGDITIHAYGIKMESAAANAAFANYNIASASSLAKVVASRQLKASDYTLSQTRGAFMAADASSAETSGLSYVNIDVKKWGNFTGQEHPTWGTVEGPTRVVAGRATTLTATPANGYYFIAWRAEAQGANLSTDAAYTFTPTEDMTLYAVFSDSNPDMG